MVAQVSRLRTMISANRFFVFVATIMAVVALVFAISARNHVSNLNTKINQQNSKIDKIQNQLQANQAAPSSTGQNNPSTPVNGNYMPNANGQ